MEITTISKRELRDKYGVSRQTFVSWLKPILAVLPNYNPKSKLLTPAQVRVIIAHLGEP